MKNYFSHDEGARNDPKLIKVLMRLGQAGKGVYWDLIEMLYEQGGYLQLAECDSYAFALRTDCDLIKSLINDFDLFKTDGSKFWSESLLKRLEVRQSKSDKAAKSAAKRWGNANAMQTHSEGNANKEKEKKVKESKVNTTEVVEQQPEKSPEKVLGYTDETLKTFTPPSDYQQKKASHTGGAGLTDSVAHPFRESPLFDKEKFRLAMEREGFETLDPDYYHGILRNWSELGTKLRPGEQLSHNWLRELRNFIQRDKSENKLRLKKEKPAKALRITSTDTNINYDELSKQYGYTG
ncbi:Lin1244/Lin1753 domain-containing protein [Adhaeribacter aquaticus]|uniref:Lin1244/Lin1753 domain-containing protein n=1 Tax=Adhaeribacter aquaticus TaxID=299567 RepID=UPI00047AD7BA|nr:Lin1244/Lin1753 domain-containing protein [Adhaeribacter aquaticus]